METHARKFGVVISTIVFALLGLSILSLVSKAGAAHQFITIGVSPTPDSPPSVPGPHEWVVVTGYTGTIHMVNAADNTVYGPFLEGQLGSKYTYIYDVAVTPDGKTALISNFDERAVYFVDISTPLSPSLITSVTLAFASGGITYTLGAEDIAITPNGKFALVSNGGFSRRVASIDIAARTVITVADLGKNLAQAVAIAPNGTVLFVNYYSGTVLSYLIDDFGQLTFSNTYTYSINNNTGEVDPYGSLHTGAWKLPHAVNVGIAPDGQTVILCDPSAYNSPTNTFSEAGVYLITAPGVLSFTTAITGITAGRSQSVAFNPKGNRAYLSQNGSFDSSDQYDHVTVLNITAPGVVSLGADGAAEIPRHTYTQLFGVDTIAVADSKAFVGHPSLSADVDTMPNSIYGIDLTNFDVITLTALPASVKTIGVTVIPSQRAYLPIEIR